ncbi:MULTISPECIES: glutamate--cysteine ligase [Streptomycetaceae]|uniref:carboxylate-amine ligase n=1 Tax=Embleya scabrispora TaxID=159449 RepID=UPI000360494B|nr:glutamate--cysteine ligase [Embleya scabrispora]MYS86262.1 YbdK family carboxylate-amine ligase [Streptomyces sp. SID5474]
MITLGVEEEYLLLNPADGEPVARAEAVRAASDLQPALRDGEVQPEMLQVQVEVATPVCESLDEVGEHLLRMRRAVSAAAEQNGCMLAACGAAPFACDGQVSVTARPRYRSLYVDAPQLVDEQLINGMHVHVRIPDRGAGVAVINRLRPWLPLLVAMSANSPLWHGDDTGFASWRTVVFGRWSVSGIPPLFADATDYDHRVDDLLDVGALRDRAAIYWQARLSERYPTVEIRAMDVQLRVDDAVLLAGIVRALITTAIAEDRAGAALSSPAPELLASAQWHAARYGLGDRLIDPRIPRSVRAADLVGRLMDHVGAALEAAGDGPRVTALVDRLLTEGTGAARQRAAMHRGGPEALLGMLATETTAAPRSERQGQPPRRNAQPRLGRGGSGGR